MRARAEIHCPADRAAGAAAQVGIARLIGVLERVYSGQRAEDILAFDVGGFFARLGLDQHLTMGRRNGLAAMVQRIRHHAEALAA